MKDEKKGTQQKELRKEIIPEEKYFFFKNTIYSIRKESEYVKPE